MGHCVGGGSLLLSSLKLDAFVMCFQVNNNRYVCHICILSFQHYCFFALKQKIPPENKLGTGCLHVKAKMQFGLLLLFLRVRLLFIHS